MICIDNIKDVLIDLSGNTEGWHSDFTSNLQNKLTHDLASLQIELKLLKDAYQRNDLVTVQYALMKIKPKLLNVADFFLFLANDIEKFILIKRGELPEIPEGYDIPESYNYIVPQPY
ncbi:hypothetical protein [Carnimonas bestiolae]|uniref:hypothetical protein n=1 Tax=Carnimonas bestiolae TaxID=3402172 RepID=UPI003EDC2D6C